MWIVWVRLQAGLILYIVFCMLESCLGWERFRSSTVVWLMVWVYQTWLQYFCTASISFSVCRASRVASRGNLSSSRRIFSTLSSISLWTQSNLELPASALAQALMMSGLMKNCLTLLRNETVLTCGPLLWNDLRALWYMPNPLLPWWGEMCVFTEMKTSDACLTVLQSFFQPFLSYSLMLWCFFTVLVRVDLSSNPTMQFS